MIMEFYKGGDLEKMMKKERIELAKIKNILF